MPGGEVVALIDALHEAGISFILMRHETPAAIAAAGASLFTPGGLVVAPGLLRFDMPVMLAVAAACLPVFFVGNRLDRWEGALFLGYYAAYLAYLTLDAVEHHATDEFRLAMVAFVMPITAATIAVLVWRAARARAAR